MSFCVILQHLSVSSSLISDTQIQKRTHTSSCRHVPDSWWGHQISLTNILTLQVRHSESQYSGACFSSPLIPVDLSLYPTSPNIRAGPLRWTAEYTSHINTQPSHISTPTNHWGLMESQQQTSHQEHMMLWLNIIFCDHKKHGCPSHNTLYESQSTPIRKSIKVKRGFSFS